MAKYTDAQVQQYMGYVSKNYGDKYTPDQMKQYETYVRSNFGDDQAAKGGSYAAKATAELPQGHEDNPLEADLYGSDVNRAKASFGDTAGVAPLLTAGGFSDVKKNKGGDLVAKAPNGKFYKDQNGLLSHPINWLESKAGGALPTAGMMGGAVLGEGAASIPLAAAGSGAGEAARIALGKKLGVYQGDMGQAGMDVAGETVGGGAAELGGKIIGKLPIPGTGMNIDAATKAGLEKLVGKMSKGATKLSSAMTGVDSDAYLRQLTRPDQVKNALEPGNALRVARSAQDELSARAGTEGSLISKARQEFAANHGNDPIDTTEMIGSAEDAIRRNLPNSSGKSGMTPDELGELQGLANKDLSGQKVTGQSVTQVERQSPVLGPDGKPLMVTHDVSTPITERVAAKPAGELQKTADWMQEQVNPKAYSTSGPTRSGKSSGAYQRILGQLKDAFHAKSPELAGADARFSDYANKAKILGPIENDATGESFSSSLFGANKSARQEAAQSLVPKSYEGMADIGASKAMSSDPRFSKLGPSAPAILRGGVSLGSGMAGFAASGGSLEGGLLGLGAGTAVSTATSPMVHKQFYYLAGKYGMPAVRALVQNPQIAPAILDSADLKRLRQTGQNIWSQMSQKEGNKK